MTQSRIGAVYAVRADPASIAERAQALALEQSVELPLAAVRDARVRDEVVARVESIAARPDGRFAVRLGLAAETVAGEPGQLMNMLFGNSSLHDDVELVDVDVPDVTRARVRRPPLRRRRLARARSTRPTGRSPARR